MATAPDLTGQTFELLTVLGRAIDYVSPKGQRHSAWMCRCRCGQVKRILAMSLKTGNTRSCGCLENKGRYRHGHSPTPTYKAWSSMKQRCSNPNVVNYQNYGGRGIRVYDEWLHSFEAFLRDVGERPSDPAGWTGKKAYWSLDRIDPDGDYEPGNVRWATPAEQRANQRSLT